MGVAEERKQRGCMSMPQNIDWLGRWKRRPFFVFRKRSVYLETLSIRQAVPSDLKKIVELDTKVWEDVSVPDGSHVWRLWIDHAIVVVAEWEKEIVGAALAFPSASAKEENLYLLHKIFVRKDRRGELIGFQLLSGIKNELVSRLGGASGSFLLTVKPGNEVAKRLYGFMGFEEVSTVPNYYGSGKDRTFMKLSF